MADFNFLDIVGGEFAEQILAEIIAQGILGEELLKQFKINQSKARPDVKTLINEAEKKPTETMNISAMTIFWTTPAKTRKIKTTSEKFILKYFKARWKTPTCFLNLNVFIEINVNHYLKNSLTNFSWNLEYG